MIPYSLRAKVLLAIDAGQETTPQIAKFADCHLTSAIRVLHDLERERMVESFSAPQTHPGRPTTYWKLT